MPRRNAVIVTVLLVALVLAIFAFSPTISKHLNTSILKSNDKNISFDVDENTSANLIAENKFSMLEFYYPGCGPCKVMNKTSTELFEELDGQVAYGRVNIREHSQIAKKYKVTTYPTLLIFRDGAMVNKFVGNTSKSDIVAALKELKPSLDMSGVKLASAPNATTNQETKSLYLTNLSEDKPNVPVMVTDDNIDAAIQKYPHLVLDAFADWCAPCKTMSATVDELSEELQGQVAFGMIDVGKNKQIKAKYNITSYPTLFVYKDGKLLNRSVGNRAKSVLVSQLKGYYPDLNTSKVKLQSVQASQKAIPLAELGAENPSRPMLITDGTLSSALKRYPFLVVEGFAKGGNFSAQMNQTILNLSSELQGQVAFGLIDIRRNNATKGEYNITSYPTTIIFKNGTMVETVVGYQKKSSFVRILKQIEPNLNTSNVTIEITKPAAPPRPKLTPEQACVNMTKSDQPLLVAYVVSHCPFGLQMQRIMANVSDNIPEAAKYMEVRYIGSAFDNGTIMSMHGEEEAQENLRQICIREEQPDKYWDYVQCYMKEGKSEECITSASIDAERLDSCTSDTGRGPAYARKDFVEADKYSITGSPTLMMGGKIVSEFDFGTNSTNSRSPEALKELLCCGFESQPDFCEQQLNTSRAATMYAVD
jgi:thioredoxin 1